MAWWLVGYYLAIAVILVYVGVALQARSRTRWPLAPYTSILGSAFGGWLAVAFWGHVDLAVLAAGLCLPVGAALGALRPMQPAAPPSGRNADAALGLLYAAVLTSAALVWSPQTRPILLLSVLVVALIRIALADPFREWRAVR